MKIIGKIQEITGGDVFVAVSVNDNLFEVFKNDESINQAPTLQQAIAIMNAEIKKAKRKARQEAPSIPKLEVGESMVMNEIAQSNFVLRSVRSLCSYYKRTQGKKFTIEILPFENEFERRIKITRIL